MTVFEEESTRERTVDLLLKDYNKKLRELQSQDTFSSENVETGIHQELDGVRHKIKQNFSNVKLEFEESISELEGQFLRQYKQYLEFKQLSSKAKHELEHLYKVRTTVESIKSLEQKRTQLEAVFKEEHSNLMKVYREKQSELNSRISADRQSFELEMFQKRSALESNIDDLKKQKERVLIDYQN